jgi:acyl dehydratase
MSLMGFRHLPSHDAKAGSGHALMIPGLLTAGIAEGLAVEAGLTKGAIALLDLHITFKRPVYVGDVLQVRVEKLESRPSSRDAQKWIERTRHLVSNLNGEVVIEYVAARLVDRT